MTINKAKTSNYNSVTPRWIVDYIQRYAAELETVQKRLEYILNGRY